ncbi:MAG: PHP domain-containing protein [Candidatus Omnitrophica bacterium]|nr:PHP domain-containing protein [Candidatus Omnitrophota bacterium]
MKFADLHVHSNCSDGTLSGRELAALAGSSGLAAISLVDHDSVSGIDQAQEAASAIGLEVIPGVELTAEYDGQEIHILGYLIDHANGRLLEKLAVLQKNRVDRIFKMTKKLKEDMDVRVSPEAVFELSQGGTVGRLHVARAMVQQGLVNNVYEAFHKFIGDKCPGYVAGFKLSPEEGIAVIKDAGGIPVLAHPYTVTRDALIPEFVGMGLQGLEVYYSEHSQGMVNFYLALAKKHRLLVTGGSDFHGEAKPGVKLGSVKVPYELVEKLKQAQRA